MSAGPEGRGRLHGWASAIAKSVLGTSGETERLRRDFLRLLARAGKCGTLLDVGAADGVMTLEYAKLLDVPRTGVAAIEAIDEYIERFPKDIEVSQFDIEKEVFPFPDGSFDIVVCNQVLEHLKNIFMPLSEMERVLKPGGWLALGVPNLAALHNRVLLAAGYQPLCNDIQGPHVRAFAHGHLLGFLKSNPNFSLVAWAGSSLYPLPFPLSDFGARLLPGLSTYTFYLLRKKGASVSESAWMRRSVGDTCL